MSGDPVNPISFSAWLKRQRRILDITRDELGRRAHCSSETIKKIESDDRLPSKELAGLMADALNVPPEQRDIFVQFARGANTDFLQHEVAAPALPSKTSEQTPPFELLETKLFIPAARSGLVTRPRLIALLKTGLSRPLTLISAPAGFGKTTLVAHLVELNEITHAAWLSLDSDDNDVTRFLAYLLRACQRLQAGVGQVLLQRLQSKQPPPPKMVLASLINELIRKYVPSQQSALVLDDYHVITSQAVHEAVAYLIDNLPPMLHLVLTSRADPPLPLARLRARNQVLEIRAKDLRFTLEESSQFLQQVMGLSLTAEQVATLEARTEGWVTGLQLAAISMRGQADLAGFIADFSGSNRFVLDYLADEVLANQTPDLRKFLLCTSILERLCGDVCDAITEQTDGQDTLLRLEQTNLFVFPLDHERAWYRYHHLFADVLRARVKRESIAVWRAAHTRASVWFEAHGFVSEAVHHATAAENPERAAHLIEQHALNWMLQGNAATVRDWMNTLPSYMLIERPKLMLARTWILMGIGRMAEAEALLHGAEKKLVEGGLDHTVRGELAMIHAMLLVPQGDMRVFEFSHRALADLPADSPLRPLAGVTLGNAYYQFGDLHAARQTLTQTLQSIASDKHHIAEKVGMHSTLALVLMAQGHLTEAAHASRIALELAGEEGEVLPNGASLAQAQFGIFAHHQNQPKQAEQYLRRALAIAQLWHSVDAEAYVCSYLAWVLREQGSGHEALQLTERAEALTHERGSFVARAFAGVRVHIWLYQGHITLANEWAAQFDAIAKQPRPRMTPLDLDRFARVRVWMVQQQWESALAALITLQHDAEATGHALFLLQAVLMQAVVHQSLGQQPEAFALLARALTLTEPEGLIRLFLDEGEPMQQLLTAWRSLAQPSVQAAFADRVLSAYA